MAPPTKLTPSLQTKICDVVRAGSAPESAAVFAGICSKTYKRWMERGRRSRSGPYRAFARAIEKAERDCEVALASIVRKGAANGDIRAARFILERRFRERWGKLDKVEVSGEVHHGGGLRICLPPEDPDPTIILAIADNDALPVVGVLGHTRPMKALPQ